jgi:hypothetical protein
MSIWRNNFINQTNGAALATSIAAALLVAGCSSTSSPPPNYSDPGSPPPAQEQIEPAQVQHPVLPPTLSPDEMAKLCQQAPDTCHRVQQTQPLNFADLEVLGRLAIGADEIIGQVKNTKTIYYLTAENIIALRDAGLSDKVIDFLVDTPKTVAHATP